MWFFYAKKNVFAYYARFKVYEVGILNTKKKLLMKQGKGVIYGKQNNN